MTTEQDQRAGKRTLNRAALDALLATTPISPAAVRSHEPLPGGTYNTIYRLHLTTDPATVLLKLPPDPATPALTYEEGILLGETTFYDLAAREAGVPVPEVVHADPDGAFLLMTECPGTPWDRAQPANPAALRHELGRLAARLHTVTGPHFGYPARPSTLDWPGTFTAMLDAVLDDATRFGARLPSPPDAIRALAAAARPALAEVTTPVLVHFDLWPGNILITDDDGATDGSQGANGSNGSNGSGAAITAIIDGERMFWGDPLAEFATLTLCDTPDSDPALLAGYGVSSFDEPARVRMALYSAYLYVIMLTELHPRAFPPAQAEWTHTRVTPPLVAALDLIADITGAPR
ncbi:phosphotransferase family protein [Streptomyces sp. 4N509B]|uniref:phosphotransferase family protein n=1 Tax=Streptomyces sp. 4N509B TaxID=3457413 RepID=UPI003FD6255D